MEDQIYNDGEVYFNASNPEERTGLEERTTQSTSESTLMSTNMPTEDLPENTDLSGREGCDTLLISLTGILKDVVQELASLKQMQNNQPIIPNGPSGTNPLTDLSNNGAISYQHEEMDHRRTDVHSEPRASLDPHVSRSLNAVGERAAQGVNNYSYSHTPSRNQYDRRVGSHQSFRTRSRAGENTKIPSFTGKEDWQVWLARFEAIGHRFSWTEDEKLDQILPRLEGQAAQFAFVQLPSEMIHNYKEFCQEMNCRFRVIETHRAFAAKFSRRNQNHGEPVEDYAANMKMLYDKAH